MRLPRFINPYNVSPQVKHLVFRKLKRFHFRFLWAKNLFTTKVCKIFQCSILTMQIKVSGSFCNFHNRYNVPSSQCQCVCIAGPGALLLVPGPGELYPDQSEGRTESHQYLCGLCPPQLWRPGRPAFYHRQVNFYQWNKTVYQSIDSFIIRMSCMIC